MSAATAQRHRGIITHWVDGRGYGFLSGPSGDVFVHISNLPRGYQPTCGDAFSYVLTLRDGKPRANDVRPA
jgi:cold shock CspA family protein